MIIPRPIFREEDTFVRTDGGRGPTKAYIDYLFNLPTWKCAVCRTVMFGTCKHCVVCWLTKHERVLKP